MVSGMVPVYARTIGTLTLQILGKRPRPGYRGVPILLGNTPSLPYFDCVT